jgi:hypothetical protein
VPRPEQANDVWIFCPWGLERFRRDAQQLHDTLASQSPRAVLDEHGRLLESTEFRTRLMAAQVVLALTVKSRMERLPPELRGPWMRQIIKALRVRGQQAVIRSMNLYREARELERAASGGGAKP